MISLELSEEDGLALQWFFLPLSCLSHPRKRPFERLWEMRRDEGEGSTVLYTSAKEGLLFCCLLGPNQFCSHHHVLTRRGIKCRYWEETGKYFTSLSFLPISLMSFTATSDCIILAILSPPSFLCVVCRPPWKGREWSASLTSWHHMSLLVLGDRDLLFSHALW